MIVAIFREEYLALIDSKHCYLLRCCTSRLIQLFRWLTKDGAREAQIMWREIYSKPLSEHVSDEIALCRHGTDSIQEALRWQQILDLLGVL